MERSFIKDDGLSFRQDTGGNSGDRDAKAPPAPASSRTVTRAELAIAASRHLKGDRRAAYTMVSEILDEIVTALADGEDVLLSGFGKFQIRAKGDRIGRNPMTGVEAPITARRVVVFKPSRSLRATVADGCVDER